MPTDSSIKYIPLKERSPIPAYPNGWMGVADSSEVSAPDANAHEENGADAKIYEAKVLPIFYCGLSLIVYRHADGEAQVASAYCPHMGAHLASLDGGKVVNGTVVCPFHGWQFSGKEGLCSHIPYAKNMPPSNPALTLYPTREVNGIILFWFHAEGVEPEFEPVGRTNMDAGGYTLHTSMEPRHAHSPTLDMLENIFDGAHVEYMHKSLFLSPDNIEVKEHSLHATFNMEAAKEYGGVPLKSLDLHAEGITFNTLRYEGIGFDLIIISSYTPVDNDSTEIRLRFYTRFDNADIQSEASGLIDGMVQEYINQIDRDIPIWNYKQYASNPKLCDGDGMIHKIRKYGYQFYSGM